MLKRLAISALLIAVGICGCSSGAGVIGPNSEPRTSVANESHMTWGTWQFIADPVKGTLDVIQLRDTDMHINALTFLEPPALVNLTLESLKFIGNIIEVDIGLRHPFLGLNEFTGFDVCGVLITNGSVSGFAEPNLVMTGAGDTRLLNPDGYTRWWNPAEFPHGTTMFSYKDGLLGAPDSTANYNATLNAYKLFCDSLTDPKAPVGSLDPKSRCVFSAGQKNIRHYRIELGSAGLIFNYAVDACWQFPNGSAPWQVPDDFGPNANRPEAWNAVVTELSNTLWNDGSSSGGDLSLSIDVWDHYNAGLNTLTVESPGNITPASSSTPTGGGQGYSTYQVDITNATPSKGTIKLLIEVKCEQTGYQDMLPGKTVTAYFTYTANVSSQGFILTSPNGGEEWEGLTHHDITWVAPPSIGFIDIYYSKDNFASDNNLIKANVANTGTYDWYVANDPSTTVKVKIKESGGTLEDASDNYFTILKGKCNFGATGFTLVGNYLLNDPKVPAYPHPGVFCSRQDPVQRLFCRNYYNPSIGNNGGIIFVFNASNPLGGIVNQYDTGTAMYTNNPEAMWVDSYSLPGIDRIIYCHNGDTWFHRIDWNGTDFVNPADISHSYSLGIWRCCLKPNGDFVTMNVSFNVMYFWIHIKSNNYASKVLFKIDPADNKLPGVTSGAWVQKMAYDPAIDALLLLYNDQDAPDSGAIYAVNANTGDLITYDDDVFGAPNVADIAFGLNVDFTSPDCRVIAYGSPSGYSDTKAWIVRYSADLKEKRIYELPGFSWGLCNGSLQTDGTLWASPDNNYARFFKFSPPPDW